MDFALWGRGRCGHINSVSWSCACAVATSVAESRLALGRGTAATEEHEVSPHSPWQEMM